MELAEWMRLAWIECSIIIAILKEVSVWTVLQKPVFGSKYSDGVIKHSCIRYLMMDSNFFLSWRVVLGISHLLACIKIHEKRSGEINSSD